MAKYLNNNSVIHGMRPTATDDINTMGFESISRVTKKEDLIKLLELLNTTNDVNLLEKIFSALSGCLMFGNADYDMVIKCNAVYEKIRSMLLKGVPKKVTAALHLLSALLVVDAADDVTSYRRMLGFYARGRCRTSGCLAVLNDMFTNCMMYHDTWKALCQCISIACWECEMNQTYCTHLIPVCIEKCSQANTEVFLVLHSLMLNHKRNIQLFFECNGAAVFTREVLVNDRCLQLLAAVAQEAEGHSRLHLTGVGEHLRNFIHLYGPHTQIGQKAMIILHHIDPRKRDSNAHISERNKTTISDNPSESKINIKIAENELDDTQTLLKNIMKEIFALKKCESEHPTRANYRNIYPNVQRINRTPNVSVYSPVDHLTPTLPNITPVFQNSQMRPKVTLNRSKQLTNQTRRSVAHERHDSDMSFLDNDIIDYHESRRKNKVNGDANISYITKACNNISNSRTRTEWHSKIPSDSSKIKHNLTENRSFFNWPCHAMDVTLAKKSFKPIFASTPHKTFNTHQKINVSKIRPPTSNMTSQSRITQHRNVRAQKRRPTNTNTDIRNRSLSSKFFNIINNSCTTFVKSVANIFKRKDCSEKKSKDFTQTSILEDNTAHSLSFMKYMRKRDAALRQGRNNRSASVTELSARSCSTCDTLTLKRKLTQNEQLKKTIRKLKLGVNLFGCDFKKISRMWPPDSYMTPEYLSKLYRRLLLK